jgi:hypothetical protein
MTGNWHLVSGCFSAKSSPLIPQLYLYVHYSIEEICKEEQVESLLNDLSSSCCNKCKGVLRLNSSSLTGEYSWLWYRVVAPARSTISPGQGLRIWPQINNKCPRLWLANYSSSNVMRADEGKYVLIKILNKKRENILNKQLWWLKLNNRKKFRSWCNGYDFLIFVFFELRFERLCAWEARLHWLPAVPLRASGGKQAQAARSKHRKVLSFYC